MIEWDNKNIMKCNFISQLYDLGIYHKFLNRS